MNRTLFVGLLLDMVEIALEEIALVHNQEQFSDPKSSAAHHDRATRLYLRVSDVHSFPALFKLML